MERKKCVICKFARKDSRVVYLLRKGRYAAEHDAIFCKKWKRHRKGDSKEPIILNCWRPW